MKRILCSLPIVYAQSTSALVSSMLALFASQCFSQDTTYATAARNLSIDSLGRVIDITFSMDVTLTAPWDRFRFDINIVAPLSRDAGAFLGDLTGDGVPDLILASFTGERVFFPGIAGNPRQFGNGSYLKHSTTDPAEDPYQGGSADWITGAIGDLDGDGKSEILIEKDVYSNIGTSLEPKLQYKYSFSSGGNWDAAPSIGDLNGDGKLDVIISTDYSGGTWVFWNNSTVDSYAFSSQFLYKFTSPPDNRLSIADLNGDGLLDLAGASGIYFNTGTPKMPNFDFTKPSLWNVSGGDPWLYGSDRGTNVFLTDANGDKLIDAYASSTSSTVWQVLYYQNVGTSTSHKLQYMGPVVVSSTPLSVVYRGKTEPDFSPTRPFVAAGDIDQNNHSEVLLSDGSGLFGAPTILWNFPTESGMSLASTVCYQDLYTYPKLKYVDYDYAAGPHGHPDDLYYPPNLFSAWIDLTRDGLPDAVQTDQWMDEYKLYLCKRNGMWPFSLGEGKAIYTTPSGIQAVGWGIALTDVNLDGKTDLVTGEETGGLRCYQSADTIGSFRDSIILRDSSGTAINVGSQSWPAAIDLDGDGDMDFLVSNKDGTIRKVICSTPGSSNGYALGRLLGTPEQNPINVTHVIGGGTITPSLTTIDIDKDGLFDVVMGDKSGRVWLLHNVGNAYSASFSLNPLCISRTTAAYMEKLDARSMRLYFALPTQAEKTKISYHGIPTTQGSISGAVTIHSSTTDIALSTNDIPDKFELQQNYPNPFNPTTNISISIPSKSFASLKIFDVLGREVATIVSQDLTAGKYTYQWKAESFASGIYFYRLHAGDFSQTRKLVLVK